MESITKELREWFKDRIFMANGWQEIRDIADRIDAEHEKAVAAAHSNGITEYGSMVAREYVKLPVDADGEVWHVGDFAVGEVNPKNPKAIERMIWYGPDSGWQLETNTIIYPCPDRPRHHHAPTVEDVLREFVTEFNRNDSELCDEEIIERFATKLRLAGDGE